MAAGYRRTQVARVRSRIATVLRAALAVGVVFALFSQQWQMAFATGGVLGVALIPFFFRKVEALTLPPDLEAITVVVLFASLLMGEILGFYERLWWWDLAIHTVAGFLTAIFGFLLVHVLNEVEEVELHMKSGFVALFAFCFSVTIGTAWELFEFGMDTAFGLNMQKSGLVDTMTDLIVNALGAMVISVLGYVYLETVGKESFLEQWIVRFVRENPRFFGSGNAD